MKEVITRDFINQRIRFVECLNKDKVYNIKEFNDTINYWKIILYEGYNLRPGNRICIYDSTIGFLYTSLFFAASELGLEIITPPEKATDESGYVEHLEIMTQEQGLFDAAIIDEINQKSSNVSAMAQRYCKSIISDQAFFSYKIKDDQLYKYLVDNVLCTEDSILVHATTSGSTGIPKPLKYTHKQLHRIAVRNIDVLGYKNNSVCHTRNLHHSFILMTHFLPSIHASEEHYSFPLGRWENIKEFIELIKQLEISKVAITYKGLIDDVFSIMTKSGDRFKHNISIIVGGFHVSNEFIKLVKQVNIQEILSLFGTNETFGPLFVKHIKQSQDLSTYRSDWYPPTDGDFFTITSVENKISVTADSIGIKDIVVEDTLIGDNIAGYIHKGRENLFRINEIYFTIPEIHETVVPYCDGDFDICVDASNQKLYLAVWSGAVEFEKLNQAMKEKFKLLQFDKYSRLDRDNYSGFKVNMNLLRNFFNTIKE